MTPIKSLDARYYTDPQVFEIEMNGLFAKTWQFACHASEVANPGDYYAFNLAGEDLFVVRDRDGALHCYYNVCQHRAHQLVQDRGNTRVIVCPYHAWTYELTGGLRAAPNTKTTPGFDKSTICLNEVRTEEFLGFVFVNLDPDAKPMEDWFPNARAELEEWVPNFRDLKPVEWVEIPENCNWKVSIENYSECYHCSLNHPTFSTGVVKPETYDIQPQGHCLRHTTECSDLDDMTYDIHSGFEHWNQYSSWFLWPMFSFQVYPGNVLNTYHWRAVDADHVVVWRGWYKTDAMDEQMIKDLAVQDRETTVEEDIHLVESVQRGLRSRGYVPGPLVLDPDCGVMSEHSIKALQQWMREGVDG
ncbi:MAG: aromatic ring-hydroxylating dioxygenase subunit alpha [Pseudomonadota bacterium]